MIAKMNSKKWKCKSCHDNLHDVCEVFLVVSGNVSYCSCDCNKKKIDDAEVFGAAFSRLANTNGSMLIESSPRRPSGMIYKIYEMSKLKKDVDENSALSRFKIHEIPATMAVDAGLINQEFLDAERERLGPMYPMYYECDFYNSSSTWYKPEMFQYGDYGEDM